MIELKALQQRMIQHLESNGYKHIGNYTFECSSENSVLAAFKHACAFVRSIADIKAIKLTDKETKVSKYFLEVIF